MKPGAFEPTVTNLLNAAMVIAPVLLAKNSHQPLPIRRTPLWAFVILRALADTVAALPLELDLRNVNVVAMTRLMALCQMPGLKGFV